MSRQTMEFLRCDKCKNCIYEAEPTVEAELAQQMAEGGSIESGEDIDLRCWTLKGHNGAEEDICPHCNGVASEVYLIEDAKRKANQHRNFLDMAENVLEAFPPRTFTVDKFLGQWLSPEEVFNQELKRGRSNAGSGS